MGVVCGPRGRSEHPQRRGMVRLRAGPTRSGSTRGSGAADALLALAVRLKELGGYAGVSAI